MTRASGGDSRGRGPPAGNTQIQASSEAQHGWAQVLPHHAPARGPSAAAAPWVPGVGAEGRLPTLLLPPPLGADARASSAPPPPGLLPRGPRHLPAALARARGAPLPSATCGLGAGGGGGV